jgi:hypothetical protein
MSEENRKRLMDLRLDRYAVDQGMMLNGLVGALTSLVGYPDRNGKVEVKDILEAVERAHRCNVIKE